MKSPAKILLVVNETLSDERVPIMVPELTCLPTKPKTMCGNDLQRWV